MTLFPNADGPYEAAASDYLARGWSPLSLPAGCKHEPLRGWTGYRGRYVESLEHVAAHAAANPGGNVAVRVPDTVIGVDVDAHSGKRGLSTLVDAEVDLGPLPPTYRSSARDAPSGIRFYRVPGGLRWRDLGEHVETVSWHHRYAVVAPSTNPDAGGSPYRWFGPDGEPCEPPAVADLPELPAEWVARLSKGVEAPVVPTFEPIAAATAVRRIEGALVKLMDAVDGNRNNALNWTAYLVGGLWARLEYEDQEGDLSDDALRDSLESVARDLGLPRGEAQATMESGWAAGVADPMKATLDEREDPRPVRGPRGPHRDVSNAASAADWLSREVGRPDGPLAGLFQRAGGLVHLPRIGEEGYAPLAEGDEDAVDGPAQVREVGVDRLRSELAFRYDLTRTSKKGEVSEALFPVEAAKTVINGLDHAPNLRLLRGVTHTPMLREDGSVLDTPGYDDASRRAYLPLSGFKVAPVPDRPNEPEVRAARDLIEEMVADFPFNTKHDRANYWCALITPLLRELAPPPYKMIVVNAHQRGSGKSLLAQILRQLHGGVLRGDAPPTGEEFGKQITAVLSTTTAPVVQFDNVVKLKATQLDALLTTDVWSDRRLGVSETVTRRNDRLWVATGNNIVLGGDLTRRVLWVSIDPSVPRPEARTDFKIADLSTWVRERRGELLSALLTLVRDWVVGGRPTAGAHGSDGFNHWLTVCQGVLDNAGVDGRIGHPDTVQQVEADEDTEWAEFLAAIESVFGDHSWLVKELVKHDPVRTAMPEDMDAYNSRSIGKWLLHRRGRWAGGLRIVVAGELKNTRTWRVERFDG